MCFRDCIMAFECSSHSTGRIWETWKYNNERHKWWLQKKKKKLLQPPKEGPPFSNKDLKPLIIYNIFEATRFLWQKLIFKLILTQSWAHIWRQKQKKKSNSCDLLDKIITFLRSVLALKRAVQMLRSPREMPGWYKGKQHKKNRLFSLIPPLPTPGGCVTIITRSHSIHKVVAEVLAPFTNNLLNTH